MDDRAAARGLGWASIAIGLSEMAAPGCLARFIGVDGAKGRGVLRVLGAREVMHGADILTHRDAAPGVWARVAGDALDVAYLVAAGKRTRRPGGLAAAFAMVLGIGLLDVLVGFRLARRRYRRA